MVGSRWKVHIYKDLFKFSAAHMTLFPDGTKERIHGHNYQVSLSIGLASVEFEAMLGFRELKDLLKKQCDLWDEKVLIAKLNPFTEWVHTESECEFKVCQKRYVFPSDEVLLLEVDNVTVENLARLMGESLWKEIKQKPGPQWKAIRSVELRMDETKGQGSTYIMESHDENS